MKTLQCPSCKYVWQYSGRSKYATCPRCHSKLSVQQHTVQADFIAAIQAFNADYYVRAIKKPDKITIVVERVTEGDIDTKELDFNSEEEAYQWLKEHLRLIFDFFEPTEEEEED